MEQHKGIGVNIGSATGTARLASDPDFKEGDILVAIMTKPADVPAMKLASGIATEIGSITCHAAIVARELGKPCVVRTGNATVGVGKIVTVDVKSMKEASISW